MADPYDPDLDWWFHCADAFLGEKGNLSSTISALERGGANIGVFTDPKEDWDQLEWHRHHEQMDRYRKLKARFLSLPRLRQNVLIAFYGTSQPAHIRGIYGKPAGVITLLHWVAGKLHTLKITKAELARVDEMSDLDDLVYRAYLKDSIQRLEAELRTWIGNPDESPVEALKSCVGREVDLLNVQDTRTLQQAAKKTVKAAHDAWKATKPRKVKDVLQDYQIPLPQIA